MKGMNTMMPEKKTTQRKGMMMSNMPKKHEMIIRREPNHNVHVITHHGKLYFGRKGRTTS